MSPQGDLAADRARGLKVRLMIEILHYYLKDRKLWELWYTLLYYG